MRHQTLSISPFFDNRVNYLATMSKQRSRQIIFDGGRCRTSRSHTTTLGCAPGSVEDSPSGQCAWCAHSTPPSCRKISFQASKRVLDDQCEPKETYRGAIDDPSNRTCRQAKLHAVCAQRKSKPIDQILCSWSPIFRPQH